MTAGDFRARVEAERVILSVADSEVVVDFQDRPVFDPNTAELTHKRPGGGSGLRSESRFGSLDLRLRTISPAVGILEVAAEFEAPTACRVVLRSFAAGTSCSVDRNRTLIAAGNSTTAVHVMTADEVKETCTDDCAAGYLLAPTRNLVLFLTMVQAASKGRGGRRQVLQSLTAATGSSTIN